MTPMIYNGLMVLCFFVTCMLIGIILLQQSKSGGGLGFLSGGGASESFLGANASTILLKVTTVLVVIFLSLCLIMATGAGKVARAYSGSIADDYESVSIEEETMESVPVQEGTDSAK